MSNGTTKGGRFPWNPFPGGGGDPVPPWLLVDFLDKLVLRDLVIVELDRSKAVQEANLRALDQTREILTKKIK